MKIEQFFTENGTSATSCPGGESTFPSTALSVVRSDGSDSKTEGNSRRRVCRGATSWDLTNASINNAAHAKQVSC